MKKKKNKIESVWAELNKEDNEKTNTNNKPETPKLITVTETYDFAGEAIKVTKQVSADQLAKLKPKPKPISILAGIPIPKVKAAPRIDNILDILTEKKKKMSTLEKSKLDWEGFKTKEGLTDELDKNKKSGYLDKVAFLQRADWNQFEMERGVRQKQRDQRGSTK